MIRSVVLWGRIMNYLNLRGNEEDPHPMWHPESIYANLIQQTEAFESTLPDSLKYGPENLHAHETEGLANQFLFLHILFQQNILFMNCFAVAGGRLPKDVPKEFVTKAGAKAFEAAKMKRYWGMLHIMSENLKDQYRKYADASRQGASDRSSSTPAAHIFQYGDWFDQYPPWRVPIRH
ncbi:hypothetical protein B0O99DRAFT_262410 [Bisporella sp. PMI_857]|nr:hypothetical protein B0O99DRAFT_262410 [Bisporella sp. PMI_857]